MFSLRLFQIVVRGKSRATTVRVGDGKRQGVCRIVRLWGFLQSQHHRHHSDDLLFFGATVADHRLLDLIKQGFINGLLGDTVMTGDVAGEYIQSTINTIKYGDTKTLGEQFLAENGLKEGVITTASGLQYEVIKMGKGKKPAATDRVKVHYHGTLTDGTVFDSSVERGEPTSFGLNQVIKGWTEGLQLMPVGSKFRFYIPQELGYGGQQAGSIPPYSTLIFEVELLEIEK